MQIGSEVWSKPREEISTVEAARSVSREARREHVTLRHAECARSEQGLPRSFICFAEGPNDMHLAYRVSIRSDGRAVFAAQK